MEKLRSGQELLPNKTHQDSLEWGSTVCFMQDELSFINKLLHSYIFEPNTPNLFERLQDYIARLDKMSTRMEQLGAEIASHEKELGGMLECVETPCDEEYLQKHSELNNNVKALTADFRQLKLHIFNYAGGILRNRKP